MINVYRNYISIGHPNHRGFKRISTNAIVIHYTANEDRSMGDVATEAYFGRKWIKGTDGKYYEEDGKTLFAYGSAQVIADEDSISETMDLDDVAWHAGDSRVPDGKGEFTPQPAANIWLRSNPNYKSLGIEICDNADWGKACANAADWIVNYIKQNKYVINMSASLDPQHGDGVMKNEDILILRHYDVTMKLCPKPFVDSPSDWKEFVTNINNRVKSDEVVKINYLS
jgi:N-acetylmuramoyl-L-alanine amidase